MKCVFICMGDQSYDTSIELSDAIAEACKATKRNVAVIGSSDFNHYESASIAEEKDTPAIEAITNMNPKEFQELIHSSNDSACGYGPISVAALFAKNVGAAKGTLLKYANSGEATQDFSSVVAYASIAFQ